MNKIFKSLSKNHLFILISLITIISLVIFRHFLSFSRLYIYTDIGGDTFGSYWPWYAYLSDWAKNGFPSWNFRIGIGTSIFSGANLLFDPFNLIYMVSDKESIAYLFPIVFVIKIIFSGVFFYLYLNKFGFTKNTSLLVALLYAFNGYVILWGQHYWFVNIIVYAPLLLYSFELLLKQRKWIFFSIMVSVIAANSYYFLYMITIFLAIYAVARYLLLYKFTLKSFFGFFIKLSLCYLLGIGLSAVILFPSAYTALSNPRLGMDLISSVFQLASISEYISMLARPFSNDILGTNDKFVGWVNYYEAPQLYCGLLTLLLIPQIINALNRKGKLIYGIFAIVLGVFILFPYGSVIFNAFSTANYRWTFIIIIFELIMLAHAIEYVLTKNVIDKKILNKTFFSLCSMLIAIFVCKIVYNIFKDKNVANSIFSFEVMVKDSIKIFIIIGIILLLYYGISYLYSVNKLNRKTFYVSVILVLSFELIVLNNITVNNRQMVGTDYVTKKQGYFDNTNSIVDFLKNKDTDFYRIEKSFFSASWSEALFQNFYGTSAYNSLTNPSYSKFLNTLEANNKITNNISNGFKDRPFLQTLMGVRYYISKNQSDKPFGYEFVKQFGELFLFENKHFLPLGFTYDSFITENDFSKLSINDKEKVLLESYMIENQEKIPNTHKNLVKNSKPNDSKSVPINLDLKKAIFENINNTDFTSQSSIKFKAVNEDPRIIIPLDKKYYNSNMKLTFDITSQNPTNGQIFWKTESDQFNENNSKKFSINSNTSKYEVDLGFINADSIRLDIGDIPGEYKIENIGLLTQSPDNYISDVAKLKKETLSITSFNDDHIEGNISLSDNKLLFLSIPFDKGWHAYIDGVSEPIHLVSAGMSGVYLTKGTHEVTLKYTQPGLIVGGIVSIISLALLLLYCVILKKIIKKNNIK
ncbi:YfhO family protein [Paenibacillus tyrfis]|uniref:YfhO family protein n=1 Tax=Paenibacillus tyrfis TaxID=1501230 RepID=UPI00209E8624|nr:YfhO family protein [Paenibacillus tyrfis]MCP1309712.1 YfhO family protein [Paenibacillus tyrfis]